MLLERLSKKYNLVVLEMSPTHTHTQKQTNKQTNKQTEYVRFREISLKNMLVFV